MEIIQTSFLTRKFKDTIAVNELSIHVNEGDIYGFVGLNGAGKTTLIRMLLGMIKPDSGKAYLFGQEVKTAFELWNNVGYMVETPYAYPDLSVIENLEVYYILRRLKQKGKIREIIDKLGLGPYSNKKAKHLSMGNKQRLGLAKALLHQPRLLILDEPVNGLDPAGIVEIRSLLQGLAAMGTTIFLSSHILGEVSRISTKIGIIHQGKLTKELPASALEKEVEKKVIVDTLNNEKARVCLSQNGYLPKINTNRFLELNEEEAIDHPERISALLAQAQLPPVHISVFKEDLEGYFLRLISNK